MKPRARPKLINLPVGAVIVVLVSWSVSWFGLSGFVSKAWLKKKTLDFDIVRAEEKVLLLEESKQKIEQNRSLLERFYLAAPDNDDSANLLAAIEAIANQSGVLIKSVAPQIADQTGLSLGLSTVSTYPQLKLFLTGLEKNLRPLDVNLISLAPLETVVDAQLQIKVAKAALQVETAAAADQTEEL